MRQYDGELKETVTLVKNGAVKQAIEQLEKNNTPGVMSKDKDILYYFEKGELLTLDSSYAPGRDSWLKADEVVRDWEDNVRTDAAKVIGDIGSFLVNDKTRRYDGQDYEKVMLSTNLTLSHIMLGNYDFARIEMKKTYEREKLIETFREKEYDKLQEDAKTKNVTVDVKQMKEYPMGELDTPEVNNLKNGFQNAFSHYLAGYFFEVTGESSLAEPGYRNALKLAPNSRIVQAGLKEVGRRKPGPKESDVLFVIESGFAPSWKSVTIPIPIPRQSGLMITPLSFPLIKSENPGFVPSTVSVAGKQLQVETLTNLDTMARRLLKDQMPGILLRTVIRAVVKSVATDQAYKGGVVLGVLTNVATVVSEQADDRSWRTLPERISVARSTLPQGKQMIQFQTGTGSYSKEVDIGSRFTIIPIRITGGTVYVGQPNTLGSGLSEVVADTSIGKKPARKPVKKTSP
ncbi:COG3014 family protein [Propionivibrio sp.]|uniref:COG3014 family protein n=1 Tax=Propionivibrio sp. TaxID=2212460 RepID=UPI003BF42B93